MNVPAGMSTMPCGAGCVAGAGAASINADVSRTTTATTPNFMPVIVAAITFRVRAFLLTILSVAVACVAISGCDAGDVTGDDKVTLRFWNGFTGPDGRTMLALVKRFNEQNADVHVVMQRMEWGTYYNKLFVSNLGGRAPQVFVVHTDNLTRFHRAGFLRPMDD